MSTWLARVLTEKPGFEAELVARFSERLLAFARQQLPACVQSRVDPEDVVQSVYRSFFQRLHAGQFRFEASHDLWRLLAAMTFRKARNAVKFHLRDRRDSRRAQPLQAAADIAEDRSPNEADLEHLVASLDQLLAALPESRRAIVVRRLEGVSVQDIAKEMRCTRQTVYRVLSHVQEIAGRLLEESP